ncbi:Transcription factor bye1 [Thecaphora frezii]
MTTIIADADPIMAESVDVAAIQPQEAPSSSTGPRRGTRIKRPTRRAMGEELSHPSTPEVHPPADGSAPKAPRRSSRSKPNKQTDAGDDRTDDAKGKRTRSRKTQEPTDDAQPAEDEQDPQESEEDDNVYCICKGKDDGTPMISCETCHDWFHFKCIKLTKAAARKLTEYRCQACTEGVAPASATAEDSGSQASDESGEDDGKDEKTPPEPSASSSGTESGSEHAQVPSANADDDDEDDEGGEAEAARTSRDASRLKRRRFSATADRIIPAKASRRSPTATASATRSMQQAIRQTSDVMVGNRSEEAAEASPQARRAKTTSVAQTGSAQSSPAQRRSLSVSKTAKSPVARKTSLSGAAGSSNAPGAELEVDEAARAPARRVITSVLENIFSTTSLEPIQSVGGTVSLDQVEQTKSPQAKATDYAREFEEEMFKLTAEQSGSTRMVGQRYREKFRTFLFSLKDKQNQGLHLRIASGQLQARDLAHMSKNELANESIRQATEKAKQEALHRSTLLKQEAGPHRKITHKGEVEIDNDSYATQDQGGKFARAAIETKKADATSDAEAALRSPLPPSAASPTAQTPQRSSHSRAAEAESDPSPSAMAAPASPTVPSANRGEAKRDASAEHNPDPVRASRTRSLSKGMLQSPSSKFDFSSVWGASDATIEPEVDGGAEKGAAQSDVADDAIDVFQPDFLPDFDRIAHADSQNAIAASGDADDFIDTFLGGQDADQDGSGRSISPQVPTTIRDAQTPEAEPPSVWIHGYRPILWTGAVILPDVGHFSGIVRQIAGQDIVNQPWSWPYFFPTSQSVIEGRLPSKMAMDYLLQVRTSSKTRIVVFTLEARFDQNALSTSGTEAVHDETANMEALSKVAEHFKSLDRWGVLHKSTRARESGILKDIYLVPLKKEDPVPVWLDLVEPDALGREWSQRRDRDVLLIPAVVYSGAIEQEAKRLSRSKKKLEARVDGDGDGDVMMEAKATPEATQPPGPASVTPSLAATLAALVPKMGATAAAPAPANTITSTALQDLLRSIGKSASTPLEKQQNGSTPPPAAAQATSANSTPLYTMPPPPPGPAPRPPSFLSAATQGGCSPYGGSVNAGEYDSHAGWDAKPSSSASAGAPVGGPPPREWTRPPPPPLPPAYPPYDPMAGPPQPWRLGPPPSAPPPLGPTLHPPGQDYPTPAYEFNPVYPSDHPHRNAGGGGGPGYRSPLPDTYGRLESNGRGRPHHYLYGDHGRDVRRGFDDRTRFNSGGRPPFGFGAARGGRGRGRGRFP